MKRLSTSVVVALAVVVMVACGGKAMAPVGTDEGRAALMAKKSATSAAMAVKGFIITSLGERTLGPFMARRPDGTGLVAWVTASEGNGRRVVGMALAPNGEPKGGEKAMAVVGLDTTMLVVKTMRGPAPGFVIAWTALTDHGEALSAIVVGDDGTARGRAVELARTSDDVVWVDVIPTDSGAVCVWAEETRGGDANVVTAALDTDGKLRSVPARVASGVTAWHALEIPGGVGFTSVAPAPADPKSSTGKAKGGTLSFLKLDPEARALGAPIVISNKPSVSGDVEVIRHSGREIFAWTDRTGDEPFVAAASLDDRGTVEAPRRIASGRGGAALLGLAGGTSSAALLYESPARHGADDRRMHVARINVGGQGLALDPGKVSFDAVGRATPELAATSTGFAALAPMRDCEEASPRCQEASIVPTILRTDETGAIVQKEPFTFGGDPASMAWGLTCGGKSTEECFALAASGSQPARVRTAALSSRNNVTRATAAAAAAPTPPKDGPHIADVAAIATGESIIDIAAATVNGTTILAMLSAKDVAGPKKGSTSDDSPKSQTLTLTTRVLDSNGVASSPTVITTRALAVGGVAIAPAEKPEEGAAIAWVARENGDPEVHVTRLDKKGKRSNDVQLTTTKGDASDVAITWVGNGWVVAWVDGRDGNGEVYATRIGMDLTRVAREERITNAPGDASDLVALTKGDLVWLAWADPRESPKDGMADVYTTAVKVRDAKRVWPETKILATAAHSRTPQLAPLDGADTGVALAWIEEAPMGTETPSTSGYGAMWATLDGKGQVAQAPARITLGGEGAATSIAIAPGPTGFRGVISRGTTDAIALDAIVLGQAAASPLLSLDGPPSLDVSLVVMPDGILFFNDEGPDVADKRARRARIDWTPAKAP